MELRITLHGQSVHQLNTKGADGIKDPALTAKGKAEAEARRIQVPLTERDVLISGPALRMLQTASLWSGDSAVLRFVHPLAGPREHPFRYDFQTREWDWPMGPERILTHFPDWLLSPDVPEHLWIQGINTLPPLLFEQQARRFITWCRMLQKDRVFIVTDPGTRDALHSCFIREGLRAGHGLLSDHEGGISLSL